PSRLRVAVAAVQSHHRTVQLLPGAGSRHAGGSTGGLAAPLSGQAGRDTGALLLDGGADGGADLHRLWDRVQGRAVLPDRGTGGAGAVLPAALCCWNRGDTRPGQLLPRSPRARSAEPGRDRGCRWTRAAPPAGAAGAAGASRRNEQPARLPGRPSHPNQSVSPERMGNGDHHELAHQGGRPASGRPVVDHGPGVRGARSPPALETVLQRFLEGAGESGAVRARTPVAECVVYDCRSDAAGPPGIHPEGCQGLLPRPYAVEPADSPWRATRRLHLQYQIATALLRRASVIFP